MSVNKKCNKIGFFSTEFISGIFGNILPPVIIFGWPYRCWRILSRVTPSDHVIYCTVSINIESVTSKTFFWKIKIWLFFKSGIIFQKKNYHNDAFADIYIGGMIMNENTHTHTHTPGMPATSTLGSKYMEWFIWRHHYCLIHLRRRFAAIDFLPFLRIRITLTTTFSPTAWIIFCFSNMVLCRTTLGEGLNHFKQ